jgi:predicted enzyme related to lactoylglutathione lyase
MLGGVAADWARPVVHWELEARDPERQRAFYSALFGWDVGDGPVMMIPAGIGGPEPGPAGHIRGSDRSGFTLYVQVRDLGESCRRAEELGGTVVLDHLQVPGGATLAAVTDPEGNPLTLVQQ